jgi:hypothetical protein
VCLKSRLSRLSIVRPLDFLVSKVVRDDSEIRAELMISAILKCILYHFA